MDIDWNQLFLAWYSWLSSLNGALAGPVQALGDGVGVPLVSALLLGLLATTAPCQISTNLGAFAFLARRPSERAATWRATLAYVAGRVVVYTAIGAVMLLAGRQLMSAAGGYVEWPRRLIGPAMILMGLALLGVLKLGRLRLLMRPGTALEGYVDGVEVEDRPRGRGVLATVQQGLVRAELQPSLAASARAGVGTVALTQTPGVGADGAGEEGASAGTSTPGPRASFLMGMGFSLAFCPTMMLLFFGATLSLAARSREGFVLPAAFGLGAVLPLVLLVALAMTGAQWTGRIRRGMRRANRPLRWLGGAVLIAIGLHDTLIYWFL